VKSKHLAFHEPPDKIWICLELEQLAHNYSSEHFFKKTSLRNLLAQRITLFYNFAVEQGFDQKWQSGPPTQT
jgi:hypothetical protein